MLVKGCAAEKRSSKENEAVDTASRAKQQLHVGQPDPKASIQRIRCHGYCTRKHVADSHFSFIRGSVVTFSFIGHNKL